MSMVDGRGPHGPVPLRTGLRGVVVAGLAATLLLFGVLAGWSAVAMIGGAVIATGEAVVDGKPRVIQHLDGGIVTDIAVTDGTRVAAGDLLLRLDPTMARLNLDIALGRLSEALARRARLEAEHLGLKAPIFVYAPLPFPLPDTATHEEGQRQVFAARADLLRGARERLAERLAQGDSEIAGLSARIAARREQLALIETELGNLATLVGRGLARASQLSELQRARADYTGQIATLEAEAARARIALRDAEIETLQGERSFREQVVTDLRAATAEIDELALEIVTRRAQLDRIEIRAPEAGTVHELAVTTPGAVIAPGATILELIPDGDRVAFDLRVDPRQIDRVWPGQRAQVVFASFDPQTVPRIVGEVARVSPAAVSDRRSGASYFRIALDIPETELARLGRVAIVPGMPVEAFLETTDRSVLDYLLTPVTRHLARAFREE